jgi:hypothetical protein
LGFDVCACAEFHVVPSGSQFGFSVLSPQTSCA